MNHSISFALNLFYKQSDQYGNYIHINFLGSVKSLVKKNSYDLLSVQVFLGANKQDSNAEVS